MTDNVTAPVGTGTVLATHQFADLSHGSVAVITDQNKVDAVGDVAASPAANTILGRLKAIATALAGLPTSLGIKTGANSLSIVPASDAGMATDATLAAMSGKLPASLGAKTSAQSISVTPASDAGLATAANQATAQTSLSAIAASVAALEPAKTYIKVTPSATDFTQGVCRYINVVTEGYVKLKQPDGTIRDDYYLFKGINPVETLRIDVATSTPAAATIWAHF
jgi:hypothetical protein